MTLSTDDIRKECRRLLPDREIQVGTHNLIASHAECLGIRCGDRVAYTDIHEADLLLSIDEFSEKHLVPMVAQL